MATKIIFTDQNNQSLEKAIAEADLPIYVYFEEISDDAVDERDFLEVDVNTGMMGMNGLPVFALTYAEFSGDGFADGEPAWYSGRTEHFMSEASVKEALLKRAQSASPHEVSDSDDMMVELVIGSFETTLQQVGPTLGSILASTLNRPLPASSLDRTDYLITKMIGKQSSYYDAMSAQAALRDGIGSVSLPAWKWLEIKVAIVALRFIQFKIDGEDPIWEDVWDSVVISSSEVTRALDGLTTTCGKHFDGQSDNIASMNAAACGSLFYRMAKLSISVQNYLQKKKAA